MFGYCNANIFFVATLFSRQILEPVVVSAFSTLSSSCRHYLPLILKQESSPCVSTIRRFHGVDASLRMANGNDEDADLISSVAATVEVRTLEDDPLSLEQMLQHAGNDACPVILSCLSHFGDFNAWELTQQYVTALKEGGKLADTSTNVVLVGIGSVASANQFAKDLDLESLMEAGRLTLLSDSEGAVTSALGCYKGWLSVDPVHRERYPQTDVSPYVKLLGMIFGFGSPGTIGNVVYGYIGDTTGSKGVDGRSWVVDSLLQGSSQGRFPNLTPAAFENIPVTSTLRPFELATLRLQTGLHIVRNWGKLVPQGKSSDVGDLLTRMGGTFVLDSNGTNKWSYFDQGILSYVDVDEVYQVVKAIAGGDEYVPWTAEQRAALNRQRQELLVQQVKESTMQESPEVDANEDDGRATTKTRPNFFAQPVDEVTPGTDFENQRTENNDESSSENDTQSLDKDFSAEDASDKLRKDIVDEKNEVALEESGDMVGENDSARGSDNLIQDNDQTSSRLGEERHRTQSMQAKELFQRALLQSKLSYAATPSTPSSVPESSISDTELFQRKLLTARLRYTTAPSTKVLKSNAAHPTSKPDVENTPNKASTRSSAVESATLNEKELFQRNLLQAQYQYNIAVLTSSSTTDSDEPEFVRELTEFNGASNPNAIPPEGREELFHRALLQAQLQNKPT